MSERRFFVEDGGAKSDIRKQQSGITQGCTLSPLLFITVMSVIMHDAVAKLSPAATAAYNRGDLADLAFADDTLVLGASSEHITEFLAAIAEVAAKYGLELHMGKLQLLQVGCQNSIYAPNGEKVKSTPQLVYLGSSLASDGRVNSELCRRIGVAKSDFSALRQVWKQTSLPRRRRLEIFRSLVESKLLYGLATACFNVAELRKLDGFQAKCIRQILGIPSSYQSRIPNADVLQRARCQKLSSLVIQRQLHLLGKVLRAPDGSPMRDAAFIPNTLRSATDRYVRRVGRPRKEWIPTVLAEAYRHIGSHDELQTLAADKGKWKEYVQKSSC